MSELSSFICNCTTGLLGVSVTWNCFFASTCLGMKKAKTIRKTAMLALLQVLLSLLTYGSMFITHWEASYSSKSGCASAVIATASWIGCQSVAAYISIMTCNIYKQLVKESDSGKILYWVMKSLILIFGLIFGYAAALARMILLLINSDSLPTWQGNLRIMTLSSQAFLTFMQCFLGILVYYLFIKMAHQQFSFYSEKTGWGGFHLIICGISGLLGIGITVLFSLIATTAEGLMITSVVTVSALLTSMLSSTYVSLAMFSATAELTSSGNGKTGNVNLENKSSAKSRSKAVTESGISDK
ncbi:hypothetical protein HDV06_003767 [Boothiomyces sp. JEL0866]|nr:hypothetical protein HDV06_003767 [Boothiomyces sp. JEL0866]